MNFVCFNDYVPSDTLIFDDHIFRSIDLSAPLILDNFRRGVAPPFHHCGPWCDTPPLSRGLDSCSSFSSSTFWKLSTVYSAVLPPSVMLFYPHYLPYCHYHNLIIVSYSLSLSWLPSKFPPPPPPPSPSSSPRHFDSISAFFFYTLVYSSSNSSWTWCMGLVHHITQRIILHFCAQLLLAWPTRWVHN